MSAEILLFGGNIPTSGPPANDTHIWSVSDWTQIFPATSPGIRSGQGQVFDSVNGRAVLFGGENITVPVSFNDTWFWDGFDWVQQFPGGSPFFRSLFGMAFSPAQSRVVLFGGHIPPGLADGSTFSFDGSNWSNITPGVPPLSPTARSSMQLAYDIANGVFVMFGGFTSPGVSAETWTLDISGSPTWTLHIPVTSPPGLQAYAMAYDEVNNKTILFGGEDPANVVQSKTWSWDGATWTDVSPATSPSARAFPQMCYNVTESKIFLFGGISSVGVALGDTWTWDGVALSWTQSVTSPQTERFEGSMSSVPQVTPCLSRDAMILMSDGKLKAINEIDRGDLVNGGSKVAKCLVQKINRNRKINVIKINKDALGLNQPTSTILITENHPIIYKDARRPAKCFKDLDGVEYYENVSADQILPVEEDGSVKLYDLQFEIDGSYTANGLLVQSRSPKSLLTPLPMELYFDQSLYNDERVSDTYDHEISFDDSRLVRCNLI